MKKNQRGATLIIVLFVIVLISSLGVVAIKRSASDLKVSTVTQIEKMNFQTSDAAFAAFERMARVQGSAAATDKSELGGYVLENTELGEEVTLCYSQSLETLFDKDRNLTHRVVSGGTSVNSGICNIANKEFVSSRNVALTQLTLVQPGSNAGNIANESFGKENDRSTFDNSGLGGSGSGMTDLIKAKRMCAYAVSLIPAFAQGGTSDAQIQDCLNQPILFENSTTHPDSMRGCLQALNVPVELHLQEYESRMEGVKVLTQTSADGACTL